ncbi:Predicted nucleotidyltransferase [Chitinophaga sp. YR573]|uniref:nucleotidyl transferase AbiEii/AbiGii toxin family protein n=1 Tax=Chitinophaga sp. YR573 TaxID=1881040 RepID=UPI0008D582E6|nr:nucleotidyl transferase AbiEii/AbiGii toxin family protein [Chitinophaga sp. YR573]SEV91619.1 Predicted nucleotidyltransferase [Chitinophaga sp. YR573]
MESNIILPAVLELLAAAEKIFKQFGVEFYLVGALARDIHLSVNPTFMPQRKTKDVDIAILISDEDQFYAIKEAMVNGGDFSVHETEAIKLIYKQSIEIDLLPFGGIENELRETLLHKPRLFVIDVPGFMEAFIDIEEFEFENNIKLKVCSLEAIILLKIIANDDNPRRTKDITDIEHIISVYFDLNDEKIYQEELDVLDLYDTNDNDYLKLVSARIIGRYIGNLLTNSIALYERIIYILRRKTSIPYRHAIQEGMLDSTGILIN